MSEKTRYFKIGMFAIGGLILLCIGLMLFGAGAFFKTAPLAFETYFDETVQGLDIGAPVKFRGVKVGEVKDIAFVKDVYEKSESIVQMKQYFEYILVRFSVDPKKFPRLGSADAQKLLDKLANEFGLRVKLVPIGITGLNYLEMNFVDPAENPPLQIDWTPSRLYIPSAHNVFTQMGNTLNELTKQLNDNVYPLLANLSEASRNLPEISANLNSTLAYANVSLQNVTDISADAKKYPSRLIFGQAPPKSRFDR